MIGRYCGSCCGGGGCFGVVSLTTYMIASKTCGSIVIVHCPIFVIESLGGFLSSSTGRPSLGFFFDGFVQYFSKMPSLSHFLLDRSSDSANTRLFHKKKSACPTPRIPKVHACSPLGNGLVLARRQIIWLWVLDGRQRFARGYALGKGFLLLLDDDRNRGGWTRGLAGRRRCPLLACGLNARRGAGGKLALLALHSVGGLRGCRNRRWGLLESCVLVIWTRRGGRRWKDGGRR